MGYKNITLESIREVFEYIPETGDIISKNSGESAIRVVKNSKNGNTRPGVYVGPERKNIYAKNIAYWLMTGECPKDMTRRIVCLDGDEYNLKWSNLSVPELKERGKNYSEKYLRADHPHMDFWKYLDYDPETGFMYWKEREGRANFNSCFAGKRAGSLANSGYYEIRIMENYRILLHRAIVKMMTGDWVPEDCHVDHINHVKTDNRWENLRVVHYTVNARNASLCKNNTSGFNGVRKRLVIGDGTERWEARIYTNGKEHYLGRYKTYEEAVEAREAANKEHGFHDNHGNILEKVCR